MERKRIVVKIGSSSLTNSKGEIDQENFQDHMKHCEVKKADMKYSRIVWSSCGRFRKLGYSSRPVTLKGKQAAAAVGQSLLIQSYRSI